MHEPTMADIAAHLGVSRQLVSIALRGVPGASDETRERVMRAATELGYNPHMGARTLRQNRSHQLGVAFTPTHATEPDIVEAMYPAAADNGYDLVLSALTTTRSAQQAVAELLEYRCAAVILIGPQIPNGDIRTLAKRAKVPMVAVGSGERNSAFDVVRSAGDIGIALIVQHLVGLGHRRITYIHGESMPPAPLRLKGYLRALEDAGLKADVLTVSDPDFTEECGAIAGRRLLTRGRRPTAVVTGNDQQAIGVLQVLSRAGVNIPSDLSLTGFDDSRFASLSSVCLTTARQDPKQMGETAITAAVRRIARPTLKPSLTVIEPSLIIRSSTSHPPSNSDRLRRTGSHR